MKGNYIAKNMNIVNRNSVHRNKKKEYILDDDYFLNEYILWDEKMKNLYSFIEDDEQLTAYNSETEEEKDNE